MDRKVVYNRNYIKKIRCRILDRKGSPKKVFRYNQKKWVFTAIVQSIVKRVCLFISFLEKKFQIILYIYTNVYLATKVSESQSIDFH